MTIILLFLPNSSFFFVLCLVLRKLKIFLYYCASNSLAIWILRVVGGPHGDHLLSSFVYFVAFYNFSDEQNEPFKFMKAPTIVTGHIENMV